MSLKVKLIIETIDQYLNNRDLPETTPVQVSKYLERKGVLKDSIHRPGKPLRDILRKGLISHAFQSGNRWLIPKSSANQETNVYQQEITSSKMDDKFNFDKHTLIEDIDSYRSAGEIDSIVPTEPGIYCFRIKIIDNLPSPFKEELANRGHNIIYIGIASISLHRRMLNQELRAKGHGTFFRSIGAVLGYRPERGSLQNKKNKRNYKFSFHDEQEIIQWMNNNLLVNWHRFSGDIANIETRLIKDNKPLFNISKNPLAMKKLSELRSECVRIANNN